MPISSDGHSLCRGTQGAIPQRPGGSWWGPCHVRTPSGIQPGQGAIRHCCSSVPAAPDPGSARRSCPPPGAASCPPRTDGAGGDRTGCAALEALHPDHLAPALQLRQPGAHHPPLGNGVPLHQHQGHGLALDIQHVQPAAARPAPARGAPLWDCQAASPWGLPVGCQWGEQGAIEGEVSRSGGRDRAPPSRAPGWAGVRCAPALPNALALASGSSVPGAATEPLLALDRLAADALGDGPFSFCLNRSRRAAVAGSAPAAGSRRGGKFADHLQQRGAGRPRRARGNP